MKNAPREMRLITTAIDLFGRNGESAVGTRAIAESAKVQMSAITYHFGGKDGLYLACAKHIAAEMKEWIAPLIAHSDQDDKANGSAVHAHAAILAIVGGFAAIMVRDDVAPLAQFVVREQMNPTPAFAVLYDGAMKPVVERMGALLQRVAKDELEMEEVRVRTIALLGQALAFRLARAGLMRATGWCEVGPSEIKMLQKSVLAHTKAILKDLARGSKR